MEDVITWFKEYLEMTDEMIGDNSKGFWNKNIAISANMAEFIEDMGLANKFMNIILQNDNEHPLDYWLHKGRKALQDYLSNRTYLYGTRTLDEDAKLWDYADTLFEVGVHNIQKNHVTAGLVNLSEAKAIYSILESPKKIHECLDLIIANNYSQVKLSYWEN